MRRIALLFLLFFYGYAAPAQTPVKLVDGRETGYCTQCRDLIINQRPEDVTFGIQITNDGDVYFAMNNKAWFNKIFRTNSFGVAVDIVSQDIYRCGKNAVASSGLGKGFLLGAMYKPELLQNDENPDPEKFYIRLGSVPKNLIGKTLEGNLIVVNGNQLCYYTNFVDIPREAWELLPMGLFADTLLVESKTSASNNTRDFFTYSRKTQLVIPFEKASASFSSASLRQLYDSINLSEFVIRKAEIRAYASVEGSEAANKLIMKQRADTIVAALKRYQPALKRIEIVTAENWIDFYGDVSAKDVPQLQEKSKSEVKLLLQNKNLLMQTEPILSKHRKALVTIYLEAKTANSSLTTEQVVADLGQSISKSEVQKARVLQKEIVERIADNKLPAEYLNKLEIPKTKDFASLYSDNEVYKFYLKISSEYEALEQLKALQKIDPSNPKVNYNIAALNFFVWRNSKAGEFHFTPLWKTLTDLKRLGIEPKLVTRMQVNYHILKAESDLEAQNYKGKDSSIDFIESAYVPLVSNDEDILSMAKFFTYYSHKPEAISLLQPRLGQIDVAEDLVFYYLNLMFFYPNEFETTDFQNAMTNAINLNPKRFCAFFQPNDKGGAGMQLLDEELLLERWCEVCQKR